MCREEPSNEAREWQPATGRLRELFTVEGQIASTGALARCGSRTGPGVHLAIDAPCAIVYACLAACAIVAALALVIGQAGEAEAPPSSAMVDLTAWWCSWTVRSRDDDATRAASRDAVNARRAVVDRRVLERSPKRSRDVGVGRRGLQHSAASPSSVIDGAA